MLTLAHFHPMLVAMQNGQWDLTPTVHGLGNLTDNSFYQVRVNAPEPLTILSNGLEIRRALITEENITRQNITLAAGPVNQFFLTASNQFNTVISKTVGETTINSYAEADYLRRDAQTALTITASALSVYNAEFGTYPFTELDIIDLPMSGLTEATMTHPGVVLLNLSYYQLEPEALERAIIHNIARQWFGQATGSNSLKDPWLVDGLSAYSSRIYATAVNNPQQRAALETIWDKLWQDISFKLPIGMPVQNYTSEHFYKTMRGHTPLVLSQLADEIGEEQVTAVLRAYTQTHRWQPGDTDAFKKLAETTCTCDLTEFFMQEVYLPRRE
ncbi:MAG: M1 family metallopeptidase [Chloroflexi bacterium]|nr:M1 family metallopeptidase [Chloroflexota bacterium]